jgi:zinc transport system permease protein
MTNLHNFLDGFFLWRDALIASVFVACLCGWLGVYILLKRIVFVSAALPQVSGLGIALAFFLGSFLGEHGHAVVFLLNPWFMALLFSCFASSIFSLSIDHKRLSGETVIGIGYILSAAFVLEILNSPRIVQEAHEIGDILFGNAVVVETSSLYVVIAATLAVLAIHKLFLKEFIAIMFDPEMASTLGLRVRRLNFLLYITFAIAVSVATRTIGALPVFGFMVIPPAASLMLTKSLRGAITVSILIGIFSALAGYYCSFVWSLPTGATMVVVSSLFLLPAFIRLKFSGN